MVLANEIERRFSVTEGRHCLNLMRRKRNAADSGRDKRISNPWQEDKRGHRHEQIGQDLENEP